MDQHDSFFTPERVDEQIDQALDTKRAMSEDQFLAEMQQAARQMRAEQERSLRRVEDRLIQHALAHPEKRAVASSDGPRRLSSPRIVQQGSIHSMEKQKEQKKSRLSSIGRRISVLVAVLVMAVLVGSLVFVISAARQNTAQRPNNSTHLGSAQTSTSTPQTSSGTFGKTVYTTPASQAGFVALAWSPDSTRVASFTNGVQIWDATTGKHLVHVQGVDASGSLAWSPNNQLIALSTTTGIAIVNGQTGAVVKNYPISTVANTFPATNAGTLLSAHMPANGGSGIGHVAMAWSHNGNFLAVAVSTSDRVSGVLQVLNPQTGAVDYTLPVTGDYVPAVLSWSADGKYVAAGVFFTEPGNATVPADQRSEVRVWNVATKQVVFQHAGGNNTGAVAWSQTSDTLAFGILQTQQNGTLLDLVTLWNAATNQLTTLHASSFGPIVWSPDGKYIAIAGTTQLSDSIAPQTPLVSIIDASTGKLVYEYTQMDKQVSTLVWSPDGHYIVSGEGNTDGSCVARVWTAE
jgi:WD40 repeat protein